MKHNRVLSVLLAVVMLALVGAAAPTAAAAGGKTTVYDGVDYALVYDYSYYTRTRPELVSAFGENGDAVLAYFVEYGMERGDQAISSFNVNAYRNRYSDLREMYGEDLRRYYLHFIFSGSSEGRLGLGAESLLDIRTTLDGIDYAPVYNYSYYTSAHPELITLYGADDVAILRHFVNYGMKLGHQACENFNVRAYRAQNRDLRAQYNNDLKSYYMHYIYVGRSAGLPATGTESITVPVTVYKNTDFSAVYDYAYYMQQYPALAERFADDDVAALEYFVTTGMTKDEIAKESYDEAVYLELREQFHKGYNKAAAVLDEIGWDLEAAFRWSAGLTYDRHDQTMPRKPDEGIIAFADFGFDKGKGNCYVMAATFCEMARLLGYDARQISGFVPVGDQSAGVNYGPHSWVEIDIDETTYVFDPDFTNETGNNGFMITYGQSGTWRYNIKEEMHE